MAELPGGSSRELEEIDSKLIQLFALVGEGLAAATDALLSGDPRVAEVLTERDYLIDEVYRDTERLVDRALEVQAPASKELRFLLCALRIVPELERSHDLAEHIARRAAQGLGAELTPRARGLVERMGSLGAQMWRMAGDSWYEREPAIADELAQLDDEMDRLHAALVAEVASADLALSRAMDMALIARFYERLGDHAVNIARRASYLRGVTPRPGTAPHRA